MNEIIEVGKNVNIVLRPNRSEGKMQQTKNTVVETVGHNGHTIEIRRYEIGIKTEYRFPWRDELGKRHFRCCRTLEEARLAAQEFITVPAKIESEDSSAVPRKIALTPELLAEAARVLGMSPYRGPMFELTFGDVCEEFLHGMKGKLDRGEIRLHSYRDLHCRVPALKSLLGKEKTGELTTQVLDQRIARIKSSARSISNFRAVLGAVLRWAVNRDKAPDSVMKAFKNMEVTGSRKKDAEKIAPFNCTELTALLNEAVSNKFNPTKANYRMVTVVALQAFAGLRATEAGKLPWEKIEIANGVIRVPANIAKTKRARTVQILPCLSRWLECVPENLRQGPVYSGCAYSKAQGRLAERVALKLEGFLWRDNALRQAFIANHIAFSDSISETAFMAGTSESKIQTNYWRLVSKADATAYFGIVPVAASLEP